MDATRPATGDATPSPAEAEVDAVLQARAVHELIRNDPRMPPKLRMLLVLYAGDLLERAGRLVSPPRSGSRPSPPPGRPGHGRATPLRPAGRAAPGTFRSPS